MLNAACLPKQLLCVTGIGDLIHVASMGGVIGRRGWELIHGGLTSMKVSSSMSSLPPLGVPGWRGKVLPPLGPQPDNGLGGPGLAAESPSPRADLVLVVAIPDAHTLLSCQAVINS